jgi:hypothetical protein
MADFWQIVIKVLLSALLGGAVGAERERTGKWAGLRTHMLIAVGAALVTDVSIAIGLDHGPEQGWDPGRVAAQIVSGLGFIGAGTIIQSRGAVHGLTTAAETDQRRSVTRSQGQGLLETRRGHVHPSLHLRDHAQQVRPPPVVRGERGRVLEAGPGRAPQVVGEADPAQFAERGGGRRRGGVARCELAVQPRPRLPDPGLDGFLVPREVGLGDRDQPFAPRAAVSATARGRAEDGHRQRGGELQPPGRGFAPVPLVSVV